MQTLAPDQHTEAVEVAACAFDADPLFNFLVPDARTRGPFLRACFSTYVRLASEHLRGIVVDGRVAAMSLFLPPGAYPPSPLRLVPTLAQTLVTWLPRGAMRASLIPRALRAGMLVEDAHLETPFHYLEVLAVAPAMQGRGLGSRMLRDVIERADAEPAPALLETSKELNVRLYRRFGFEVIREARLDGGPPIWTMRR